jgi:hypothetical protein
MADRPGPGVILESWVPWQANIADTIRLERQWLEESLAWLRVLQADDEPCNELAHHSG